MKTPNFLSFSFSFSLSLLLLKYCLRLLMAAWLLREYVERTEEDEEERARSGGGEMMALGLFLTSGVEALVRASASLEKRRGRRGGGAIRSSL